MRWTVETALEEAKKCKTRDEFRKKSPGAYKNLTRRKRAFLLDNIFGKLKNKWTAIAEAKKCKTRNEFFSSSSGAYAYLSKQKQLNLLDDIFPEKKKRFPPWTDALAITEAKTHQMKSSFIKNSAAYIYLWKNKKLHLLDDIFPKLITLQDCKNFFKQVSLL